MFISNKNILQALYGCFVYYAIQSFFSFMLKFLSYLIKSIFLCLLQTTWKHNPFLRLLKLLYLEPLLINSDVNKVDLKCYLKVVNNRKHIKLNCVPFLCSFKEKYKSRCARKIPLLRK